MTGPEVWLIGTPTELNAIIAALITAGRVAQRGELLRLSGADAGRCRQYLRLTITTTCAAARTDRAADAPDALDFAA